MQFDPETELAAAAYLSPTMTFSFSFSEYKYMISRTSGAIRFFSPQGLERANEYRREMMAGLLRQGKSLAQAQADVEAGLQNQIFAHEHSGTCDLSTGARL
jgi:hypothetical protein